MGLEYQCFPLKLKLFDPAPIVFAHLCITFFQSTTGPELRRLEIAISRLILKSCNVVNSSRRYLMGDKIIK